MLEKIDLKRSIPEDDYKARMPELRSRLYNLQRQCWEARIPTIIVFEGWGASGRGPMVNYITQNLEPRVFRLHMILAPRTNERTMPWLWRFWVKLPNYGEMAIFDQSWYRRVLIDRVEKNARKIEWKQAFEDINDFERTLSDDGSLILKFFLHISRDEQKKRLKRLKHDPLGRLIRDPEDDLQVKHHKAYVEAIEEMLMRTETEWAPWTIVEATDVRYARLKVFETLTRQLEATLASRAPVTPPVSPDPPKKKSGRKAS
jgi:AMP-polyphosphate phosphotransferase